MKKYTYLLATLIGFATLGINSQAQACAGCLDIYPEIVVLDQETQKALTKNAPVLLQNKTVRLSDISCRIPGLWAEDQTSSCQISGAIEPDFKDFEVKFSGIAAQVLYNQLRNLTVEGYSENDEESVRDGRRQLIALVADTEEHSTVSIPSISYGTLSCPEIRGKARCEIELNVLNAVLLSYPR